MAGLSDPLKDVLTDLHQRPPSEALVALQDTLDTSPPHAWSSTEHLVLLQELFRLAMITHHHALIERYLPGTLTLLQQNTEPAKGLLAYCQCTVAIFLEQTNRGPAAEALYYRALETDLDGPPHSLIAPHVLTPRWIALINLGRAMLAQAKPSTAVTYLSTVAKEIHAYYLTPPAELIAILTDLGLAHRRQGATDRALRVYLQAYAHTERLYGPDHPHTADLAELVGSAYLQQEEIDSALAYFEQAHAVYAQQGDPTLRLRSCINLAALHHGKEDLAKAHAFNLEALDLLTAHGGPFQVRLTVYWNLARVCAECEDHLHALIYAAKAAHLLQHDCPWHPERRDAYRAQLQELQDYCHDQSHQSEP